MDKIIVNDTLRTHLPTLDRQVEFCDESGRTLGHFLPEKVYKDLLEAWAGARISPEELERRRQEPRGRTLDEIWKSLGQQ
jgi:hypothetical protein